MANLTHTHYADTSLYARAATYVADFQARYAQWKLYRETLAELRSLTNRDLADLGLSRASIHSVAYESVYGA